MDTKSLLDKYVCKFPFEYLDIQGKNGSYICCPSWNFKNISEGDGDTGWSSESASKVRKSVLDGSYLYCNKKVCPSLNKLLAKSIVEDNFIPKKQFFDYYSISDINDIDKIDFNCKHILFGFDRSCNLKCPSCRTDIVINDKVDSQEYLYKLDILDKIETKLASGLETILITGSGDPFYSNIYRNYLINFDKSKYPNLKEIKIITNGIMLDKNLWDTLKSKEYIKSIEISIDAGTRDTYENITRLNGKWDRLINNLKFIRTLSSVNYFELSFVVSELNYKEMYLFYKTMVDIFDGTNFEVLFRQHVHWGDGKYTKKEVESISIFNPEHKKHNLFLDELKKIHDKKYINHNFHHLI